MYNSTRCQLYTVARTDMSTPTWERTTLQHASDYQTAVQLAEVLQRKYDPSCLIYDYRVEMCS